MIIISARFGLQASGVGRQASTFNLIYYIFINAHNHICLLMSVK